MVIKEWTKIKFVSLHLYFPLSFFLLLLQILSSYIYYFKFLFPLVPKVVIPFLVEFLGSTVLAPIDLLS